MTNDRICVVGGVRTPFVRARGHFHKLPASALGGVALRETVAKTGIDPERIEEIYFGIVTPPAEGSNISREALFDSGLPATIPCTTVNRYCASSLEAAAGIAAKIQAGQISCGIAGGVESISSVRALFSTEATDFFQDLAKAKSVGQKLGRLGQFKITHMMPHPPGIKEPTTGLTMGQSADAMARIFGVTRKEQDSFSVDSHMKAHNAWERGFFQTHVAPVATPSGKIIDRDTDVRSDTSVEKLGQLRPVFYHDGTITAGNASPLTDGASAVLLMKESEARSMGANILGFIRSYAAAGVNIQKEPLLIGPVYAIPRALKLAGLQWSDLDILEIHEAFAAQVLATIRAIESDEFAKTKLGISGRIGKVDFSKLNVNGGSIPLGHPFGATGTRLILQTLHELRARKLKTGLISVCAAGGLGSVMILESV